VVDKSLAELEALELVPFRLLAGIAPSLMTAHIVYPQIDPHHPATLSRVMLTGLLREHLGYKGVVITDALMMKAVHERYGHARAAVMALQAGADMPLAQGSREEQLAAIHAIAKAQSRHELRDENLRASVARLDALATAYPAAPRELSAAQREADEALMRQGWARALSAVGAPQVPARAAPLRVVTQGRVDSDGVSEAGLPAAAVRALFANFPDVEFIEAPSLSTLAPQALLAPGRRTVLVSNQRSRYAAPGALKPDLHLCLWNPFQVLDIAAPALVTWGYGEGALQAAQAWLEGRAEATGLLPVKLHNA
jgi:beta-N-acetylhexosaminidase